MLVSGLRVLRFTGEIFVFDVGKCPQHPVVTFPFPRTHTNFWNQPGSPTWKTDNKIKAKCQWKRLSADGLCVWWSKHARDNEACQSAECQEVIRCRWVHDNWLSPCKARDKNTFCLVTCNPGVVTCSKLVWSCTIVVFLNQIQGLIKGAVQSVAFSGVMHKQDLRVILGTKSFQISASLNKIQRKQNF